MDTRSYERKATVDVGKRKANPYTAATALDYQRRPRVALPEVARAA